jgi:hypothetical protein
MADIEKAFAKLMQQVRHEEMARLHAMAEESDTRALVCLAAGLLVLVLAALLGPQEMVVIGAPCAVVSAVAFWGERAHAAFLRRMVADLDEVTPW